MVNRSLLNLNRVDYSSPLQSAVGNSSASRFQASEALTVRFAQRTFDAEGTDKPGRFFSRQIGWPPVGQSGVTIGRGYDMGMRSSTQVIRELTTAGMDLNDARYLSRGAGLRGTKARDFVELHRDSAPIMSHEVQKKLFEDVVTPAIVSDINRIFNKPDVVKKYGAVSWDNLPTSAQELVFDLRYRGDYTPGTRQLIQPLLVSGNYQGLASLMNDTGYWAARNVPSERIKERQQMAADLF